MKKEELSFHRRWIETGGVWKKRIRSFSKAELLSRHEDKVLLLVTLMIGLVVGLVVVAFIVVTENLGARLYPAEEAAGRRIAIPVLGSLIAGYLLWKYFPDARGSGIPQTRTAFFLNDGYIPLRTVVGKFLCSSLTLASGIPLGREGPSVQVGAGVASTLARRLGLSPSRVRALAPAGCAAALSAAFNTPIAGVLFTLEEIEGDLHAPVLGSVVLSSATSWTVLRLLLGDEPLFHVPAYQLVHPVEFLFYALLGTVGGLVSVAFVKMLLAIRGKFMSLPARTVWLQPAVGGLIAALAGWLVPEVLGVGYGHVSAALNGKMALGLMALLVALKLVTTAAAYGTGNAGGIFGPSLFLGAMLGGAFGSAVHRFLPDYTGSVGAYALVGMGTAFAGIIRTPMTSVIMIFEITRDYSIIVPLMISNLLSFFVSSRLQREPVYEALLRQENIQLPKGARGRTPGLTVADAMTEITLEAEQRLAPPPPDAGRATDEAGMRLHVHKDTPLEAALWRLGQSGAGALPVVSCRNPQQVIGLLTREGALAAYGLGPATQLPRQRAREAVTAPGKLLAAFVTATLVLFAFTGLFTYYHRTARTRQAQLWLREASALEAQGQLAPAIERYRNALAVTHNPADRLALGLALVKAGRMEEAAVYLNEVLRADPSNGPASAAMGQVYESWGARAEAARWYRRAVYGAWADRDAGQRLQTRFRLADLLARSGQRQQAATELLALIEEIPEDTANQKRAAAMLLQMGAPHESAAAYQAVLQRNRTDSEAWLGEAQAQVALSRYEEAREAAQTALRLDPRSEPAGRLLEMLDRALQLDPSARGLSASQQYARSRRLLLEALAAMEACLRPQAGDAGAWNEPVNAARAALQKRTARNEQATTRNVALADRLWKARKELCGASDAGHEALALALRRAVPAFARHNAG